MSERQNSDFSLNEMKNFMSRFPLCKIFAKFFKELLTSTLFFIIFSSLLRLYPIALSVIIFLTSSCPVTCTVFSCCLSTPNGGSTACDLFLYSSCASVNSLFYYFCKFIFVLCYNTYFGFSDKYLIRH